jgi:glycosyltransferase involved in cell wall biosynthesis
MQTKNKKKIRVLRILNRFNIGGPVWNVCLLTKYLSSDFETKLVGGNPSPGEGDAKKILQDLEIEAEIIMSMSREVNMFMDYQSFREIKKIIKEFQPDIVHTHASKAGFVGRLAAISAKVPIIVHTFHGHVFEGYFRRPKAKLIIAIERWLAKKSQAIVAISELQKNDLTHKFAIAQENKVHVISLGFDLERFYPSSEKRANARKTYHISEDTIAVGIVGRLTPIKNQAMFIHAAAMVIEERKKKFKFFVVGDGELKLKLEAKTKELGIEEFVTFTSWIGAMEEFYFAMNLVCLTSRNEGTPVTLIEAQAAGVPVISTDVGGVKDVVINGETGVILKTMEAEELSKTILQLAELKSQRLQMSKNAHNFAKRGFTHTQLAENMEKLYFKLIGHEKT